MRAPAVLLLGIALLAAGCAQPGAEPAPLGLPAFGFQDVAAWNDTAWFAGDLRTCGGSGCREAAVVLGERGGLAVVARVVPPPDDSRWTCGEAAAAFASASRLGAQAQCLGWVRVAQVEPGDMGALRASIEAVLAEAEAERFEREGSCADCGHVMAAAFTEAGHWRHASDALADSPLLGLMAELVARVDPTPAGAQPAATGPA